MPGQSEEREGKKVLQKQKTALRPFFSLLCNSLLLSLSFGRSEPHFPVPVFGTSRGVCCPSLSRSRERPKGSCENMTGGLSLAILSLSLLRATEHAATAIPRPDHRYERVDSLSLWGRPSKVQRRGLVGRTDGRPREEKED